jgi:type IV pilus biogenesis protein CpaD/CtpE
MTKPLKFVVLAALLFGIAGCASDPPQQGPNTAYAAPSDGGMSSPWTIPIRLLE